MTLRLVTSSAPPTTDAPAAPPGMRYTAFLSYSHHDRSIAKRVQRRLETYRVPRRLVGRETPHGPAPARLGAVFRDRDELHAGSDLKASVHEALARSRWLIVVCTPDAARSPWVNREIVEFKKLHGERRVLALIVRGEPCASERPGREAEECFPPALRRALTHEGRAEGEPLEPIAADLRRGGDGPQRALLKLVAGMLGLPFDDLVRRDVQRRLRWLTALATASVAGVLVFAALAGLAWQARNEAQYQRQQAEGLIEFMLGDLRRKLEPVGRLDVLDAVGEKALGYYAGQDAGRLDATALGHRSRAMHLIGEIGDLRGRHAEAQQAFERAAETTSQLLAQAPRDAQRVYDHAQSVFWVGYAAWKQADGRTAEARFAEYLRLARRLVELDPARDAWGAEVAHAQLNLGVVQLGTGRADAARAAFETARAGFAELVTRNPGLVYDLAGSHGWLAMALALMGQEDRALVEQRRRLTLLGELPDAATNRTTQHEMVLAQLSAGRYELLLGQLPQAQASVSAAVAMADRLIAVDPDNVRWQLDACAAQAQQAEVLLALHRADAVHAMAPRLRACIERLDSRAGVDLWGTVLPKASAYVTLLAVSPLVERAALAQRAEDFLAGAQEALKPDTLDRESLAVGLANGYLALGDARRAAPAASVPAWRQARALLEPYQASASPATLVALARARLRLHDVQGAEQLAARLRTSPHRHPAHADLLTHLQAARGNGLPPRTGAPR